MFYITTDKKKLLPGLESKLSQDSQIIKKKFKVIVLNCYI